MSDKLFIASELPFEAIPFDKIKLEHFLPNFKKGIEQGQSEISTIITNIDSPTFENTIIALEESGELLSSVSEVFFNLNSAHTNKEMQALAQEISPLLSNYHNDILLNEKLFKRVKLVYEQVDKSKLETEDITLLENTYKGFSRNGALLNKTDKDRLRELDQELSKKQLTYGENVLAENNAYSLHIEDKNRLTGIPETALEAAAALAKEKELKGYIFTLDYPSYIPVITYADDRALRKEISKASGSKAFKDNEHNNEQLVLDIVKLRHERAALLGYDSHADYVLERRMAENKLTVNTFLSDLLDASLPFAKDELKELKDLASKDGITDFQRWDSSYYAEKLKKERFDFDEEQLRPYFKLENVIEGVFEVANKLYGLNFTLNDSLPKYHEDVLVYEVTNSDGEHQALFYADFFPRESKRQGAWMTSYRGQFNRNGKKQTPIISNVCNFTKPTDTKPSLLTFNEVTTLFHEFGHGLHGLLANGKYESISGTNVFWDFVELPSQVLENWCYEKECLDLFARHYETDELIPQELIQKIKDSSNFNAGLQTVRQLSFGILDMTWHTEKGKTATSVKVFEEEAMASTTLLDSIKTSCMSSQFSHIFQGGYSAGYYSYKWAEVLDADAFEYFKEKGIFNSEIAESFKTNILSAGGSEAPMKLYKKFRGKEPDVKALLRRAGLLV